MKKNLLAIGIVWIMLALVIGVVMVILPKKGEKLSTIAKNIPRSIGFSQNTKIVKKTNKNAIKANLVESRIAVLPAELNNLDMSLYGSDGNPTSKVLTVLQVK